MNNFTSIFPNFLRRKIVIGIIHLKSLPGTPNSSLSVNQIVDHALIEAKLYKDNNLDGLMIENMNDIPYSLHSSPETVALMTRVASEIKREVKNLPLGVQVLASRNKEALAVALASGSEFIRVENFVYSHVADEGMVHSNAAELLRYRKFMNCDHIAILTDIKKKHSSHALTCDISLSEAGETAAFFMSDGLILTGRSTGHPVNTEDVKEIANLKLKIPTIIGSGVSSENVLHLFEIGAKAVIVGSYFKKNGHWSNDLDCERIKRFIDVIHRG